ncbi:hypothetical protein EG68_07709 [Paragonimus skrjabini miyazakii]|uniref:Purine nucleoside phosphorylase n=1 Tax=Paragonimus skrjabini miyazakii TaxID=59628 RepID=A0A8S9YLW7_9TREM|nr:hypothetical protein EG68_07709 [Paragonimus skrjabini miyazakii]
MSIASYENVENVVNFIRSKTDIRPSTGIICGSGLGKLADAVQGSTVLSYADISGFPKSSVTGHQGNFVFGTIGNKHVIVMQGRFHQYEGLTNCQIVLPIRVMKLLGVHTILISNAAGGLNRQLKLGDFVVIKDHISLPALSLNNVLVGPNDEKFGPRFPATSDAYDINLRKTLLQIAREKNVSELLHEGVYACCGGPTYESIAESRMLLMFGADVTGMSTVPEVIVARHCGIRVLAVSLVTNMVVMDYETRQSANHEEVLETATRQASILQDLFTELIKRL